MHLSQPALHTDTAQLIRTLVESHPDPYSAGGGPIAFHRRADKLLAALPAAGLTDAQFLRLLRPLVASVGDGHTALFPLANPATTPAHPRFAWDVIEQDLYIASATRDMDRRLLGARLAAIEGVPTAELAARLRELRGCDNEYQLLAQLALALADPTPLAELLRTESPPSHLPLIVTLPDGSRVETTLRWSATTPAAAITPPSAFAAPPLNAARMGWSFLDTQKGVAWLRVATLRHYREAFEVARSTGFAGVAEDRLAAVAQAATGGHLPATAEERLAVVPAATELLRDLCAAMRAARSSALIVDLRECDGGNSFFATILGYFLYGADAVLRTERGYQVKRYSPLYFANYRNADPADFAAALRNGGYDFTEEYAWRSRRTGATTPTAADHAAQAEYVAQAPTFAAEYTTRAHEAHWTPRVVVLTSAWTYSAGFDAVALLVRNGATVVGVPSAQAGNCFIDVLRFRLEHSGLAGWISFKWSQLFPGEPDRGRVLRPKRALTYADLAARGFDPHAPVALALDYLRADRPQ